MIIYKYFLVLILTNTDDITSSDAYVRPMKDKAFCEKLATDIRKVKPEALTVCIPIDKEA